MELIWNKNNETTIYTDKNNQILINPKELRKSNKSNSFIIYSKESDTPKKPIDEASYVINWPGEYEISDSLITGVQISQGETTEIDTVYSIHLPDGISITVVPDIEKPLTGKEVETIGDTHILILSLKNLDQKDADKVVDSLEPNFVVPIDYESEEKLTNYLKASGITNIPEKQSSFKFNISDMPESGLSVVLLSPQNN